MLSKQVEVPFEIELAVIKAVAEGGKKGDWIVEGYASTTDPDLVGDEISKEALKEAEDDLRERSTVLHNHHPDEEVGKVLKTKVDAKGLWVKVLISKTVPDIWKKVKEGVLNKFSIRAKITKASKKYNSTLGRIVNYIQGLKIVEVSLASVPVNAQAAALNVYVQKALEEFEMKNGVIEDDSLDQLLEQMQNKGLIADENGNLTSNVEHQEGVLDKSEDDENKNQQSTDEQQNETDTSGESEQSTDEEKKEETADTEDATGGETGGEAAGDESGDTETDAAKADAEKKACVYFKKSECPVKEYPKAGEVPTQVKDCEFTKTYVCPYLKAAKSAKTQKAAAGKASVKEMLRKLLKAAVKEELSSLLTPVQKNIDGLVTQLQEQDISIGSELRAFVNEIKEIKEKQASIDSVITERKSVPDDDLNNDVKRDETDVFAGCFPWDGKSSK